MKSNIKKISDCRLRLSVELGSEELEECYREVFAGIQRVARLPGFREGKAPLELIERRYVEEAREEVLKRIVPEAYHRAVSQQSIHPVSAPKISDITLERGKGLKFAAEFERAPEVNIKNYKGIKLKRAAEEVTDDEVVKGLESLQDSRAELDPVAEPRAVRRGDFIVSDIDIWKDGAYVPGKKGVLLFVEPSETDDFFDKVVGAQVDEVREILSDPSDEEKRQGLVGRKPHYKVWVRAIKQKRTPVLDDEFAKNFGKDSVGDLREAVRKELASQKRQASMERMKSELFDKLLKMAQFELPDSLVQRQCERLIEQAKREFARRGAPQQFESDKPSIEKEASERARQQVKLYFILQRIAESEDLTADESEVERRINSISSETGRPAEEVRQMFEEDIRESLRESRTVEFLIANAKFEES
ncbi:MAG: Trigger factor [Candidatus Omnitrophica bacterium]|nr:Trigger factor [Candidatus Omnitrophota bacterium]